jgi:4-diphosphocytidyl-2-C-methyl-D-erythritol kinase
MSGDITAIREFAPAKINLFLHVTGRRADGYHLISSLMAFAEVGDDIVVSPAKALSLEIDGPFAAALSPGGDNLVMRAAERLGALAGTSLRAAIRLTKRLPVASGIGGGSADAAATLRALIRLWRIDPDREELSRLALGLGADVPVCLLSRSTQVSGIGDILEPAPPLPEAFLALVNPGVAVPTKDVFAARTGPYSAPAPLDRAPADIGDLARELAGRHNDLAAPARSIAPAIGAALATLEAAPGCLLARMSGSGATCFGLFATADAASAAATSIARLRPDWWSAAAALRR